MMPSLSRANARVEKFALGGVIRVVHAYFDAAGLKSVSEAVG